MKKTLVVAAAVIFLIWVIAAAVYSQEYGVDSSYSANAGAEVSGETEVSGSSNTNTNTGANTQTSSSSGSGLAIITAEGDSTIIIDGMQMDTRLVVQENSTVTLSDGTSHLLTISPNVAFAATITEFGTESCYEGCTVELKETKHEGEARVAYHVNAKKEYKLFGIFKRTANVGADVDAETGAVIGTDKPWWTAVSTEVKAEAESKSTAGGEDAGY